MDAKTKAHLLEKLAALDVQYSIRPGVAYVTNVKTGHIYEATMYTCDCPDFETGNGGTYDGACKHMWRVRLCRPCERCGGAMYWERKMDVFGCPSCGNARDGKRVREERNAERETRTGRAA